MTSAADLIQLFEDYDKSGYRKEGIRKIVKIAQQRTAQDIFKEVEKLPFWDQMTGALVLEEDDYRAFKARFLHSPQDEQARDHDTAVRT